MQNPRARPVSVVTGSPKRPLGIVVGREPGQCAEVGVPTVTRPRGWRTLGSRSQTRPSDRDGFASAFGSSGRRAASGKGGVSALAPGKVAGRRGAEASTVGTVGSSDESGIRAGPRGSS